jgi:hypothetical protein
MKEYDMHLAANSVSTDTVAKLFENGFRRDEFANLTYCHTGDYHGTFRGDVRLPSKDLWDNICGLLEADPRFSGYLEEESCDANWRQSLRGEGFDSHHLPSIKMIPCPAGRRKACDIHMAVFLDVSASSAIDYMAALGTSSVDRPGPEGIRRVYTITCESLADGRRLFGALYSHLSQVPDLHGRMKLEVTIRHYRKPIDATTLPIATKDIVAAWFAECKSRGLVPTEQDQLSEKRDLVLA